jgi:threonine dehydrogenase-like Zn-dependent dehydrogenase
MRMVLTGLNTLVQMDDEKPAPKAGFKRLKVLYCAVCRTDAKMWHEGHRDLVFPRVPGHEFVAVDENRRRYTVWPGNACADAVIAAAAGKTFARI